MLAGSGGGGQSGGGGSATGAGATAGSGTGGSAGGAGNDGSASAGAAGTGTSGPASCLDGQMNGDETGVDCGGSCPACPSYKINPPNQMNASKEQSACLMSTTSANAGFMCARSMVFSPEFKQAALDDWGTADPPFVYGVVGHDKDTGALDTQSGNTCCQCYQLVFTSPKDNVSGLPTPKPMIVQAFNTAAGGAKNFDIFMAAGGEGNNSTGCPKMYDNYPTTGQTGNGGIRPLTVSGCSGAMGFTEASVASDACQSAIAQQCDMLTASMSASNQSTSIDSCIETNQPTNLYHLNWNVIAERVECPEGLTRVTGCKLNSQSLPQPDPTAQNMATAGSGFMTGYGTTTMQDCCRPTCAFSDDNNVAPSTADAQYNQFYTCDVTGAPATN